MARREVPAPSLPLLPFLASLLLLPAALTHGGEQANPTLKPEHAGNDPLMTRLTQLLGNSPGGSNHSPNKYSEQTRHHSDCQTSNPNPSQNGFTCTAHCPLCPACPSAQACPSPCPAIPKCPEPQQCPTTAACPACPSCKKPIPPGYEYFKDLGYYRLHTVPVDWMTAKATCEREGAHLAIINSQDEANLMKTLFSRDPDIGTWLYLGFHDLYKEGKYVTVLGLPLSQTGYITWNVGQPDNNENNEDCGSMYRSGGLNDLNCSNKQAFVCELPV